MFDTSPFVLAAVLFGALGGLFVIAGLTALMRYRPMRFTVRTLLGLLLLAGYFVPFALIVLAAEIVNILTYHLTMDPGGIAPGSVALVLWLLVFLQYRGSFAGVLAAKPGVE